MRQGGGYLLPRHPATSPRLDVIGHLLRGYHIPQTVLRETTRKTHTTLLSCVTHRGDDKELEVRSSGGEVEYAHVRLCDQELLQRRVSQTPRHRHLAIHARKPTAIIVPPYNPRPQRLHSACFILVARSVIHTQHHCLLSVATQHRPTVADIGHY